MGLFRRRMTRKRAYMSGGRTFLSRKGAVSQARKIGSKSIQRISFRKGKDALVKRVKIKSRRR